MTAALGLALAAAVRVVDGVHRGAADGRALALPAAPAGLAPRDVLVVEVADLADGGAARQEDATHLARRQAQHRVWAVLRDELDARAGAAGHLAAAAWLELDVVDDRARRDVLERERVAGLDVGARAGLDDRADLDPRRGEDVALGAVGVVEQRDARRTVRVVLDCGHLRGDPVLRALEVDDPIAALVAAALVPPGDAPVVVAPARLLQRLEQALLRLGLRDLLERGDRHEAAGGRGGLVATDRHQTWAPWKISIVSPSRTCTMALVQPWRMPFVAPRLLCLALTLRMLTRARL